MIRRVANCVFSMLLLSWLVPALPYLTIGVQAQTSTATWKVPTVGMSVNYIDTVVLSWESNYEEAYVDMWCQNATSGDVGGTVNLGTFQRGIFVLSID